MSERKVMLPTAKDVEKARKFGRGLIPTFFNLLLFIVLLSYIEAISKKVEAVSLADPTGILRLAISTVGDSYMFTVLGIIVVLFVIIWCDRRIKLVD